MFMRTKTGHPAGVFEPYIPASSTLPELGARPLIVGTILGMFERAGKAVGII